MAEYLKSISGTLMTTLGLANSSASDLEHSNKKNLSLSAVMYECDRYKPSLNDVVIVKAILCSFHATPLPIELIDAIIDAAEYWPHTSTKLETPVQIPGGALIGREEDKFLLRSLPIGYIQDPKSTAFQIAPHETSHWNEERPEPHPADDVVGEDITDQVLAEWAAVTKPRGHYPCRKVVFTVHSNDQGWGGERGTRGTYKGSYTWFDVGKERVKVRRENGSTDPPGTLRRREYELNKTSHSSLLEKPSDSSPDDKMFCVLDTILPHLSSDQDGESAPLKFDHDLLPNNNILTKNRTATRELQKRTITWSCDDRIENGSNAWLQLEAEGRGPASADGTFVRDLKVGDVITVWGKVRFGGWVNKITEVSIDVYWAL